MSKNQFKNLKFCAKCLFEYRLYGGTSGKNILIFGSNSTVKTGKVKTQERKEKQQLCVRSRTLNVIFIDRYNTG